MAFETKEQLRARLNLAEEKAEKLAAEARAAIDAWEAEVKAMKPFQVRIAAASFVAGVIFGGLIVWLF